MESFNCVIFYYHPTIILKLIFSPEKADYLLMKHCQGTTDKGTGYFDSFDTEASTLQALKSWPNFSLVLLPKGEKYIEQL